MGKTGTSINIPPLHKQDNTLAFSDFEKAQKLNSYFASISTIDDTKLNKATGPDGISNRMLKLTHSTVSYPLT